MAVGGSRQAMTVDPLVRHSPWLNLVLVRHEVIHGGSASVGADPVKQHSVRGPDRVWNDRLIHLHEVRT